MSLSMVLLSGRTILVLPIVICCSFLNYEIHVDVNMGNRFTFIADPHDIVGFSLELIQTILQLSQIIQGITL